MTDADTIATLREEIVQLRTLLKLEPSRREMVRLQRRLRLSRYEAVVLSALYRAGGECLSLARLEMCLPPGADDRVRGLGVVRVHICRVKSKIGAEAIAYAYGGGYRLTAKGLVLCAGALSDAA